MRIPILILGFKVLTPTETRTTQSTDFKGVRCVLVHLNIVGKQTNYDRTTGELTI